MNSRRLHKAIKRLKLLPRNRYLLLYVGNKLRHFYYKLTKSTRVAYPSTVMLELTNRCNLACTTCAREHGYGKVMDVGNMDLTRAWQIVDELWPYLDSIGLTGLGETFIYRELPQMVDYIKQKNRGIIIMVSTNAVLPNFMELATPLVGKIDTIQVSVDGLNEVYEQIRHKSSFALLDEHLRAFAPICAKSTTDLMLNMVVMQENYTHMPLLVRYAAEVGIPYVDFTLFNLASVTDIDASYYAFYHSAEFLAVLKELNKVAANTPSVTITNKNFKTENCFQKCPYPWTHFYFTWDGYAVPCCGKPFPKELNFGNVFGNRVIDVLNSADYRSFRKLWYKNETPNFCKKCHFIGIEKIDA